MLTSTCQWFPQSKSLTFCGLQQVTDVQAIGLRLARRVVKGQEQVQQGHIDPQGSQGPRWLPMT